MERREFIKIVCGLVGTWPIAAYAQQVGELRRIGVLGADATVWSSWTVDVTRLRELGWTTGETIDVDYRWAGGSSKRVSDFTAEFLRRNVDVIVTYGAAAAVVRQVTTAIPVVLAVASDPGAGFIASLARPGGNVTGISIQQSELIGKRLDLLREVTPHLRRLVIMANAGYEAQKAKATTQGARPQSITDRFGDRKTLHLPLRRSGARPTLSRFEGGLQGLKANPSAGADDQNCRHARQCSCRTRHSSSCVMCGLGNGTARWTRG